MRALFLSFRQFCRQITKDSMLLIVCTAPILTGIAFKFGIPKAELLLVSYFERADILAPYYLIFDIFLSVLTPYMVCFASAMVILEDIDSGMAGYFSVTPIGKAGYLMSRLIFPGIICIFASYVILSVFALTDIYTLLKVFLSIATACIGVIISMFIVSLSGNKVEGMAIAKLGGLFLFGVPVPFLITEAEQYFAAFLPSFWLSKYMLEHSLLSIIGVIASILLWSRFLYMKFLKKIS